MVEVRMTGLRVYSVEPRSFHFRRRIPGTPVSLSQTIQRLASESQLFRTVGLAGQYDPLSQAVTVLTADSEALERWVASPNFYYAASEYLITGVHELTHWLDHTSTLWGQSLLVAIHNGWTVWHGQREEEFWRIVALHREIARGARSQYYSVTDQPDAENGSAGTWRYEVTSGLEFGPDGRLNPDRPIVFASFVDASGARVGRVPLTVMALLEANAMWAEHVARSQIIASLRNESRVVEEPIERSKVLKALYSPRLLLYSAATHLVGIAQQTSSASVAMQLASALALVALNLPRSMARDLTAPSEHRDRWGHRVDRLLELGDHGYVFLLLCTAAPRFEAGTDLTEWTEATLQAAGLRGLEHVRAAAADGMRALEADLVAGQWAGRGKAILQIGRENFVHRGITPATLVSLDSIRPESPLRLPHVVLFDEVLAPLSSLVVDEPLLDPGASVEVASEYQAWAAPFLAACHV
jgi:hypothetical protein